MIKVLYQTTGLDIWFSLKQAVAGFKMTKDTNGCPAFFRAISLPPKVILLEPVLRGNPGGSNRKNPGWLMAACTP